MSGDEGLSGIEEFYEKFEKAHKTKVPRLIRKNLELMGYSSYTIGKMSLDDISTMESSIWQTLQDTGVPEDDYIKYLAPFDKNPSKFRFLPGPKQVLLDLISFAKPQTTSLQSGISSKKRKAPINFVTNREKGE